MEREQQVDAGYRIRVLTHELMQARLGDFLALYQSLQREMGQQYSPEIWTAEQLTRPLPGKWELSYAAFDGHDNLIGFWIASMDEKEAELRNHLSGVDPNWRRRGILRAFFKQIYAEGHRLGLRTMSQTVCVENAASMRACECLGFRKLAGTELERFRIRRNRLYERVEGDHLITTDGYARYALELDIR